MLAFCDVIKGSDHLGQVVEQYPKPGGAANQSTVFTLRVQLLGLPVQDG